MKALASPASTIALTATGLVALGEHALHFLNRPSITEIKAGIKKLEVKTGEHDKKLDNLNTALIERKKASDERKILSNGRANGWTSYTIKCLKNKGEENENENERKRTLYIHLQLSVAKLQLVNHCHRVVSQIGNPNQCQDITG